MEKEHESGSMAASYSIAGPWPPVETVALRSSTHDGAQVLIEWREDATIYVRIEFADGSHYDLHSPLIERPLPASIKCAFSWNTVGASMAVAGKLVAKTDAPDVFTEREIEIPEEKWVPDADVADGLKKSALRRRAERVRSVADRASGSSGEKRLRTLEEDLSALSDRGLAMYDLLHLARDGKEFHLTGISAALRLLVCTGGQSPLLQRVAGHLDAELLMYGMSPQAFHESKANGFQPDIANFTYAWHEEQPGLYQMDLDDWLQHIGFVFRGEEMSNNGLLRLLADSDGAHSDPKLSPAFDFWHDLLIAGSGYRQEFLLRTGAVVFKLAHRLHGLGKLRLAM
jgi:hypothetical protein